MKGAVADAIGGLMILAATASLILLGLLGTGCATGDSYKHSSIRIESRTEEFDGAVTETIVEADGEAAMKLETQVTGDGYSPDATTTDVGEGSVIAWPDKPRTIAVGTDLTVTSPWVTTLAQGRANALMEIAQTPAQLAEQFAIISSIPETASAAGGFDIKSMLMKFVMERATGFLSGSGGGLLEMLGGE